MALNSKQLEDDLKLNSGEWTRSGERIYRIRADKLTTIKTVSADEPGDIEKGLRVDGVVVNQEAAPRAQVQIAGLRESVKLVKGDDETLGSLNHWSNKELEVEVTASLHLEAGDFQDLSEILVRVPSEAVLEITLYACKRKRSEHLGDVCSVGDVTFRVTCEWSSEKPRVTDG